MIEGWVTRNASSLLPMQPVAFSRSSPQNELPTIEVDNAQTFQPEFSLLAGMAKAERAELPRELFGLTEESVGLSCLRLNVGAPISAGRISAIGARVVARKSRPRASICPPTIGRWFPQRFKQRLCSPQDRRLELLGKPPVHRREH
jgi:hypothetical protein